MNNFRMHCMFRALVTVVFWITIVAGVSVLSLASCVSTPHLVGGSSSETVVGKIAHADGTPAKNTEVILIPSDYNPELLYQKAILYHAVTNGNGEYAIEIPEKTAGVYSVQAVHKTKRSRLLISNVVVGGDSTVVHDAILTNPGIIRVVPSDYFDVKTGYVYIAGTTISAHALENKGMVILDSVPEGTIPLLCYGTKANPFTSVIRHDVVVTSKDTMTVENIIWSYKRSILINTTPDGANVKGNAYSFPTLVRLTSDNFDFESLQANTLDLQFIKSNGGYLPYQIERWDINNKQAEIWVKVDTLVGNTTQSINMYWGKTQTSSDSANAMLSKDTTVFDTVQGFLGVWHMAQNGGDTAKDETQNSFQGTPYGMTSASKVPGVIGNAQSFDGTTSFIQLHGTANSTLNFMEQGTYSVSAWVSVDSAGSRPMLIIGKGHSQYYLRLNYYSFNKYWEFVEYHNATKQMDINDIICIPVPQEWKYLVATRNGTHQSLYLDGELVVDTARQYQFNQGVTFRDSTFDVAIGKHLQITAVDGDCFFKGKIDEVRMSRIAYNADWVRLCYMNQRKDDKLVKIVK